MHAQESEQVSYQLHEQAGSIIATENKQKGTEAVVERARGAWSCAAALGPRRVPSLRQHGPSCARQDYKEEMWITPHLRSAMFVTSSSTVASTSPGCRACGAGHCMRQPIMPSRFSVKCSMQAFKDSGAHAFTCAYYGVGTCSCDSSASSRSSWSRRSASRMPRRRLMLAKYSL